MRAPPRETSSAPLAHGGRDPQNDPAGHQIDIEDSSALWQRQGALESLADVHLSWGIPDDHLIRWLLEKGVSEQAMMRPWCIGGGRVRFESHHFEIDLDGNPAITLRAQDCRKTTDLIAWEPWTGKLASWCGTAACLGDLDDVFNTGTYFAGGALRVHASPLEWLKAGREGIVILRPELTYSYLRHAHRLA